MLACPAQQQRYEPLALRRARGKEETAESTAGRARSVRPGPSQYERSVALANKKEASGWGWGWRGVRNWPALSVENTRPLTNQRAQGQKRFRIEGGGPEKEDPARPQKSGPLESFDPVLKFEEVERRVTTWKHCAHARRVSGLLKLVQGGIIVKKVRKLERMMHVAKLSQGRKSTHFHIRYALCAKLQQAKGLFNQVYHSKDRR